jgi:hypothetical protein
MPDAPFFQRIRRWWKRNYHIALSRLRRRGVPIMGRRIPAGDRKKLYVACLIATLLVSPIVLIAARDAIVSLGKARAAALERSAVASGLLRIQHFTGSQPSDADRLAALVQTTLAHALHAVELEPADYRNWLTLASLYQALAQLGVRGASADAGVAYRRALALRPNDANITAMYQQYEATLPK